MEVAAAVEATAGTRVDQAAFKVTRRRCARSMEEFSAMGWLLAMLTGGGQGGTAAGSLWRFGMRNRDLKGLEGS